jgi:hypothetical protein
MDVPVLGISQLRTLPRRHARRVATDVSFSPCHG